MRRERSRSPRAAPACPPPRPLPHRALEQAETGRRARRVAAVRAGRAKRTAGRRVRALCAQCPRRMRASPIRTTARGTATTRMRTSWTTSSSRSSERLTRHPTLSPPINALNIDAIHSKERTAHIGKSYIVVRIMIICEKTK